MPISPLRTACVYPMLLRVFNPQLKHGRYASRFKRASATAVRFPRVGLRGRRVARMIFVELFVQGLVQGSIYALIAVGLTLVYGLLRILHVAHAGLFRAMADIG